jgi:protein-L-isoaspartate(D-aspartate) O-methyltransferase
MPADQLTPDASELADERGHGSDWQQVNVEFTNWTAAPGIVARHLRPVLDQTPGGWWYIRKHPDWRLRHHPRPAASASTEQRDDVVRSALDALVNDGVIRAWHPTIYEPETLAFGGPAGMRVAHELFCRDSPTTLDLLANPPTPGRDAGRAELSLLALSRLLRAAGLDWYEQGDVWHKVTAARPITSTTRPPAPRAAGAVHRLLTLDTGPRTALVMAGPLADHRAWLNAFDHAGAQLGALARTGRLARGLRAILAHHVIFHWNRLGLPGDDQRTLAALARGALLPCGEGAAP